ncbi:hypothetical protein Tco_0267252 [Tanacetum coccineum]
MREEVQTCRNQIAQLNALIAEMEAFDNPGEVFDTLMGLRDDVRVKEAKLLGLNDLIAEAKKEIEMKEAYVFNGLSIFVVSSDILNMMFAMSFFRNWICRFPLGLWQRLKVHKCPIYMYAAVQTEVVESLCLVDKMKYVFGHSRGEDESLAGLMRDLCVSLRISLSKKRRLVAELEVVGEVEGAVKCLEHMRVIVASDAVTLGELETLLGHAQIYIFTLSLKLLTMASLYILDKLVEVTDSSRLEDNMKVVFIQARGADKSFIALMRDLCSALRVSITKNRRWIVELEALGHQTEALKPLDYMREIVGRNAVTLGILEQLLAGGNVGM